MKKIFAIGMMGIALIPTAAISNMGLKRYEIEKTCKLAETQGNLWDTTVIDGWTGERISWVVNPDGTQIEYHYDADTYLCSQITIWTEHFTVDVPIGDSVYFTWES